MIGPQCPMPIGFIGFDTPAAPHLALDDQLQRGIGVESVRAGQCGTTKPASTRSRGVGAGCSVNQRANLDAARVVFGRKVDVHGCSLAFPRSGLLN